MLNNELWIDLGRNGSERAKFNLRGETGIAISGYCGTGKTNLASHIVNNIIETEEDIKIKLMSISHGFYYKRCSDSYDQVEFVEQKVGTILKEIDNIAKEVKKRKKVLDSGKKDINGIEFNSVVLVVDELTVLLQRVKSKYITSRYEKLIDNLKTISDNGSLVNIIPVYVFLRNVNFDAPLLIHENLSFKCSFNNTLEDYKRWDLLTDEEHKLPKKNGELLINSNTYKGFAKTYNIKESN